ncbi:glycosyltransferase family 2 protein [Deinococcus sp. Marseille-Q6407]|uniref:glycosyltransferase family 2 protein n=1 Tax=Deinococcus sp. Marseille-Q6407 TaxID=2969223 RepID=UPI0021BE9665|nr:glycosyltransferase [Deinococcus sp. Marseille-Q6407]
MYNADLAERPLVTIGLPVYNAQDYVARTITSVLNQTYSNWELLILDDGSSDRSSEIIGQFSDSRIQVLRDGHNRGLSERLNETVRLARGQFYFRMDADDIMTADRLEKQVATLLADPDCDVVGAAAYIIDGDDHLTGLRRGNPFVEQGLSSVMQRGGFIHPTVAGKTSWFLAHPYDVTAQRCEDIELWLRTADVSCFVQLPEPLLFYREAGDQHAKVEQTSAGYQAMLQEKCCTAAPEYRSLFQQQIRGSKLRVALRRTLHTFGAEKYILRKRSQPISDADRQAGERALQIALHPLSNNT